MFTIKRDDMLAIERNKSRNLQQLQNLTQRWPSSFAPTKHQKAPLQNSRNWTYI